MDPALRERMEASLGTDLSAVRVHTGDEAAGLNAQVGARAFTTGNDIFLGPATRSSDERTLAHELTHVVQQRSMRSSEPPVVGPADDPLEQQADQVAREYGSGEGVDLSGAGMQERSKSQPSAMRVTRSIIQRDLADPDADQTGATGTSEPGQSQDQEATDGGDESGADLDEIASQISSDTDNALGIRIPLEADLVALVANPGSAAESGGPLPGAPAPATKPQAGTATGTDSGEGLNPYRIKQGALGDCYLMAAMAAVARVNPDAIRRLIKPHPPGKYDVTLYEHRWLISDATHVETVDTTVPTDPSGKPLYGGNVEFKGDVEADRPLWPLLIEKAYAQWKGGYAAIGKGGDPPRHSKT